MKASETSGICSHHILWISLLPGDFFAPVPCAALQEVKEGRVEKGPGGDWVCFGAQHADREL